MREWFAEVQRRLDVGLDPFQEPGAQRTDGDEGARENEEVAQGESTATNEQTGTRLGEEEDEEDEEDDGDDTDDSEVWEPSRSVKKSLSVSED